MVPTEAQIIEQKTKLDNLCWDYFWLNGTVTIDFPKLSDMERLLAVNKAMRIKREMDEAEREYLHLQTQREEYLKSTVGVFTNKDQGPTSRFDEMDSSARTRGFAPRRN